MLDLLAAGRKVADVPRDLDVSDQTIYNWRRQDLDEEPGAAAGFDNGRQRRTGRGEEADRGAEGRADGEENAGMELVREVVPLKARYAAIDQMAAEGHAVQMCCQILDVAESGYVGLAEEAAVAAGLYPPHALPDRGLSARCTPPPAAPTALSTTSPPS